MKLYFDKIHSLRKEKGLSVSGLCKLTGITRATLWKWEKEVQIPIETNVRNLAKALGVSVDLISDIQEDAELSKAELSLAVSSWDAVASLESEEQKNKIAKLLAGINSLSDDLTKAKLIIEAITSSMDTIFYIKDKSLKYIIASNSFIENLKLNKDYKVLGKKDADFFSVKESIVNENEDKEVLRSGQPVKNIEKLIPGSHRKKWGIVSKYPVLDAKGKTAGLIALFVDITDRKRLEERRKMLEVLLDYLPISVCFREQYSDNIKYLSKNFEHETGYSLGEIYKGGRKFLTSLSYQIHHDALEGQSPFSEETYELFKSISGFIISEMIPVTFKIAEKDSNGVYSWREEISGVTEYNNKVHKIWAHRNCTEEKQMELQLEITNDILDDLSREAEVVTWIAEKISDEKLFLKHISSNIENLIGYKQEDLIKINPVDVPIVSALLPKGYEDPDKYKVNIDIFTLFTEEYQSKIKDMLSKSKYSEIFEFDIENSNNEILHFTTTVMSKEVIGLKTVFYGNAKMIN